MKTVTLLVSLLLIQTGYTSFTEGIDRVMANMETSFSRLLSDVITDMKDVIDCTILAVERVLSIDPSGAASEYQRKCVDGVPDDSGEAPEPQSGEDNSKEVTSRIEQVEDQLSAVISDMNDTFHNVVDSNDLRARLDHIRYVLKNETDHLASVSALFRGKLEKLSDKIKRRPDQDDDFFSEIFAHLEMLHEAEKTEHNADEIHVIHDVINEILKILQLDESKLKSIDDEDKIQAIIDKLSQQAKVNETVHRPDDGCDNATEVSSVKENDTKEPKTITTETTNAVTSNEITQTTLSANTQSRKKKPNYEDPFDLSNSLGFEEIRLSDNLLEIMRSQRESDFIINKYFNNPDYVVGDAFSEFDGGEMSKDELRSFDVEALFGDD